MYCPKCQGGAYLSEEELIRILDNTQPLKIIIRQTYVCRACSERFSRIVSDDVAARKKADSKEQQEPECDEVVYGSQQQDKKKEEDGGIQFLDNI